MNYYVFSLNMATKRFSPYSLENRGGKKLREADSTTEHDGADTTMEVVAQESGAGGGGGGGTSGGAMDTTIIKSYMDYPLEVKEYHIHCQYEYDISLTGELHLFKEILSPNFLMCGYFSSLQNNSKAGAVFNMMTSHHSPYFGDLENNGTWLTMANMTFPYWKITNANMKFNNMQMLTQELIAAQGTAKVTTGPLGMRQQRIYILKKLMDPAYETFGWTEGNQTGEPPLGIFTTVTDPTQAYGPMTVEKGNINSMKFFPRSTGGFNDPLTRPVARSELTTACHVISRPNTNTIKNSAYTTTRDIYPTMENNSYSVLRACFNEFEKNYTSHDICEEMRMEIGSMTHYTSQILDPVFTYDDTNAGSYAPSTRPARGYMKERPWNYKSTSQIDSSIRTSFTSINGQWQTWVALDESNAPTNITDLLYKAWPDQVVRQIPVTYDDEHGFISSVTRNPCARGFNSGSKMWMIYNKPIIANGDTVEPIINGRVCVDFTLSLCKADIDMSIPWYSVQQSTSGASITYDFPLSKARGAQVYGCPVGVAAALPLRTATEIIF